ncbi:beta-propeller domain-containing protein [Aquibacillus koreensis]|uniref:Beta-propeller domain-containing protein n=1 Tax=Aquibacillus koreensis TaxID=279446 RepID=A0A9X3WMQ8_9BACI|nr:beta-propeller domain-containing protein [Aquibacillus koreensis]MCT2535167.1 beta-propeller domain-containing protein [Aquibacillus koreensis]MDC3421026.1 beta-propeller domain-containing protein [Aquibacillus koreensis]
MKKSLLWWFCGGIGIIIAAFGIFYLFSNDITAQITSTSSYATESKDWSIQFSEQMNPDTFTKESVSVLNEAGEKITVEMKWNADNTILTILPPNNGYTIGGKYAITITDQVLTANGKHLTSSFNHEFETVANLPNIKDEEQLLTLMRERTEKQRQFYETSEGTEEESADAASDGASAFSSSSNDTTTSETNVQVEGIDEGDTVKLDGDYLYYARDHDIVIASTNGKESSVVSKIEEQDYYVQQLYLHNDLLISIGHSNRTIRNDILEDKTSELDYRHFYTNQSTVYIYDISDKQNPKQMREFTIEGSINSTRKMDGFLYLVGNNHPPYYYYHEEEDPNMESIEIRPFIKDTAVSNQGRPIDYKDMYFFPESDDETFMVLSSIDLNDMDKEANVETYLGASNQLYMSKNHLYTAVNKYDLNEDTSNSNMVDIAMPRVADTEIIQFHINDGDMTYNASTVVNGTLINQFSMDERNDTFRVATTKGNMWEGEEPSTNNLYTFDTELNPLGSVEGLAENERIYSVRFMENVAYMVTFRETDPLFVIDLADAKNPEVLGELKIPGFSNYLHPLDDNHVIGFGHHTELEDVPGRDEPRVLDAGLKISVFDVSDPTDPKEKFIEILGQGGSHSEISYNHKSLYQHPDENLFGIPAELYETKTINKGDASYQDHVYVYEGAFLYNISPVDGITLKDTITHQPDNVKQYPKWESRIQRMVSVGDTLYTLSFDQMKAYNLNDETILKTIEFPEQKY